jgi:hypothetical protein
MTPQPQNHPQWMREIATAYRDALDTLPFSQALGDSYKEDDLFTLAPNIALKYRGLTNKRVVKKTVEIALSSYVATKTENNGSEMPPHLSFAFCYLASHVGMDLLKEKEVQKLITHIGQNEDLLQMLIMDGEKSNLDDEDLEDHFEGHDKRIKKILGKDAFEVSDATLKKYQAYLDKNLTRPVLLTGEEDFDWEEFYLLGPGDPDEYEKLKITNPSYIDVFDFISFEMPDHRLGLMIRINRVTDNKKFILPLENLRSKDKKSPNFKLIMDYSIWFVNF